MSDPRTGLDTAAFDAGVRPQDDLYRHVNGRWLRTHEIPSDRASDGAFIRLHEQAEKDVRQIIEEAGALDDDTARKIAAIYSSFMDAETVDALGSAPIEPDLEQVETVGSIDELTVLLGQLQRTGGPTAVAAFVDTDSGNPDRYLVHLVQAGLGLPDESYYREEQYAELRDKYREHIVAMLALAGFSKELAAAHAERAYAAEATLAEMHWDRVRCREADQVYNLMTFTELVDSAPGFGWQRWVDALGAPQGSFDELVVMQPSFVSGFAEAWSSRPLDEWKSWAIWHIVSGWAPFLSAPLVDQNFEFYGKILSGTPEIRARWKRGVSLIDGVLGEAVGKLYVERHFPPKAKDAMEKLVANLVEAYRRDIESLDWMTPETKVKALAKLEKFTPKIGYPNKWRDYSRLIANPNDLIANVRNASAFEFEYELGKIGRPIDRDEWFMTPQTVNAYYNPGMNEIVFPAAILQPPFFTAGADDAVNYGGIGAVIGHEIGHGFDDQGSKYDGDGKLVDWWTDADRTEFDKRTKALIAQYGEFSPEGADGQKVNGALTVGENIGDLGGLAIAIKAYQISLDGAEPPVIDGMTGLQRLFLGWAQVWQQKVRPEEAKRRLTLDPHSPTEFRCNGVVRNLDEFAEAFHLTEADALWLAPDSRVRIW